MLDARTMWWRISRIIRHCVLYDTSFYAMQSCEDNFKVPIAFTLKKKESVALKVFPRFKWNDLGEQDVIGEGSFGAVFITKTRNKDGKSKQWLTRNHPFLKIPA